MELSPPSSSIFRISFLITLTLNLASSFVIKGYFEILYFIIFVCVFGSSTKYILFIFIFIRYRFLICFILLFFVCVFSLPNKAFFLLCYLFSFCHISYFLSTLSIFLAIFVRNSPFVNSLNFCNDFALIILAYFSSFSLLAKYQFIFDYY